MHNYRLPNGITINIESLVDAAMVDSEYPQTYLDTETGALVQIPSAQSLGMWVKEIGSSKRYFLLEHFTNSARIALAKDFIDTVLKHELPKKVIERVSLIVVKQDCEAFEDFLLKETDGWIHGWDQFLNDAAGEYVTDWLTKNPHIKITEEFVGCDNCAICEAMKKGVATNLSGLLKAFQTEEVMHSVRNQLTTYAKQTSRESPKSPRALLVTPAANAHSDKVMVFKVTLNHTKPSIWRRIIVPDTFTFFELHSAIQDAMGWADSHLHSFTIDLRGKKSDKRWATAELVQTIALPDPDNDAWGIDEQTKDERKEIIGQWFGSIIKQCIYTYDFGDSWDHTVLFENSLSHDPTLQYPQCVAGKNACPPDDCGGIWGYEQLKQVVANPRHKEHKNMLEWLGFESADEFRPAEFDPASVGFDDPKERLAEYENYRGL